MFVAIELEPTQRHLCSKLHPSYAKDQISSSINYSDGPVRVCADPKQYVSAFSSVRLKVEQHQLVVGGGWNSLVSVGLEGACYLGLLENRHR